MCVSFDTINDSIGCFMWTGFLWILPALWALFVYFSENNAETVKANLSTWISAPDWLIDISTSKVLLYGVLIALLLVSLYSTLSEKNKGEAMAGDQYNNHGNNFGHMGPVNNYGPRRMVLDDELKSALLEQVPKGQVKSVIITGSEEALGKGEAVVKFLNDNGYSLPPPDTAMILVPPPSKPVQFDGSRLVIAPDVSW